jgi:hypothetical protein
MKNRGPTYMKTGGLRIRKWGAYVYQHPNQITRIIVTKALGNLTVKEKSMPSETTLANLSTLGLTISTVLRSPPAP